VRTGGLAVFAAASDERRSRGVPQGGPLSPLLANLYFRRFILAWKQFGHERRLAARVVNYADDLVICCRPGKGERRWRCFGC
jgi:retron-type reverse transcriptase